MKLLIGIVALSSFSTLAFGFDLSKDVLVCAKKNGVTRVNSYKLILVQKSRSLVYYESSTGQQSDNCIITRDDANTVVAKHNDGINQTIKFDALSSSATWTEDSDPDNQENYENCTSFASYNSGTVKNWLKNIGLVR